MSLQPQLQIGLTYAYDPWDQIFFLITCSKIALDADVSIICANPLQWAFLHGRLWSVWVLGQFSETQVYKGVQQPFLKAFFFECAFRTKGQMLSSLSRNLLLMHSVAVIVFSPNNTHLSCTQTLRSQYLTKSLHSEHHKGVKEVDVLSENYSNAPKILRRPRGGGESQLVPLTGSWDKGVQKISGAASKCPWQLHNL